MVSGLRGYQTKRYPVVPVNPTNDKFVGVIGDKVNQRTNDPVNANLISWPSKAQNIQNLEKYMVKK